MPHIVNTALQINRETLTRALSDDEFVFYYQPKISMITGRSSGAEALLRWIRPGCEPLLPATFIPYAEATGFVTEIAAAMLPKLIADILIINDVNDSLSVSFNLSARDFETPRVVEAIRAAINHHQLDPRRLEVELTEASVIHYDNPLVRKNLGELVELGVTLAMDDYGTGYSSIDTLSQWPFARVKIDQRLIRRMASSEKCTTIVQASIRMAHQLGIGIVAEGIETASSYDFLLHSGCTDAQGFWLGEPMPLEQFLAFLKRDQRWSGLPTGLIHMAILDHVHWRQSLITQVTSLAFNGERPVDSIRISAAELDPHYCKLGRWYYDQGQEFRGNPLFDQLEIPHNRLHEFGRKLLDAARQGAPRHQLI